MTNTRRITVDGLPVELAYRRVATARITVRPDGSVRVSAPIGFPQARIQAFVRAQRHWIIEQQDKRRAQQAPEENFSHGGRILLWGRWREVQRRMGNTARANFDGKTVQIMAPDDKGAVRAAAALRRREIERVTKELAPSLEARLGQSPEGYRFRTMVSRWGTCNTQTRQITLNTWLVQRDPAGLEYVIAHELTHLVERGHGPQFKALLDHLYPGWRKVRTMLGEFMPPRS